MHLQDSSRLDRWSSSVSSVSSYEGSNLRHSTPVKHYGWLQVRTRYRLYRRRFIRLESTLLSVHSDANDDTPACKKLSLANMELRTDHVTYKIELVYDFRTVLSMLARSEEEWSKWVAMIKKAKRLRLEEWYRVKKQIGVGHYGAVYEAYHIPSGERVAVKVVHKSKAAKEVYVRREEEIVTMVNGHDNIVRTIDVFDEPHKLSIVMGYADGGNVFEWIQRRTITEGKAQELAQGLISAVAWLHNMSIIHRDIKPENLLVKNDVIKLCDFGLSRVLSDFGDVGEYSLSSICGTPVYVAPEVARKEHYGFPIDMWSCGILLYVLISGQLPYSGNTVEEVLESIAATGPLKFPETRWSHVSGLGKDFIRRLLAANPAHRMTANDALNHPWLHSGLVRERVQSSLPLAKNGKGFNRTPVESIEDLVKLSNASRPVRQIALPLRKNIGPLPIPRAQWSNHSDRLQLSGMGSSLQRQSSNHSEDRRLSSSSLRYQEFGKSFTEQFSVISVESYNSNPPPTTPSASSARIIRSVANKDRFKFKLSRSGVRVR